MEARKPSCERQPRRFPRQGGGGHEQKQPKKKSPRQGAAGDRGGRFGKRSRARGELGAPAASCPGAGRWSRVFGSWTKAPKSARDQARPPGPLKEEERRRKSAATPRPLPFRLRQQGMEGSAGDGAPRQHALAPPAASGGGSSGPTQGQRIGKPRPSLASPSPRALGADPGLWPSLEASGVNPRPLPPPRGHVRGQPELPGARRGAPGKGWGRLCLCSSRGRPGESTPIKKKRAGNQAAKRDPADFPRLPRVPRVGERHSPAPTRPRPPRRLLRGRHGEGAPACTGQLCNSGIFVWSSGGGSEDVTNYRR